MTEEELKFFAAQLRKPHGDFASTIAQKMNVGNRMINETAIEALRVQPNDTVLEIGMANGFYVKSILDVDASVRYAGCDFSEEMIEQATTLNEAYVKERRAQFKLSNAEELPFEENAFAKLLTVNTLYFWEDRTKTLESFKRVLKPGGKLVIAIRPKASMEHYPFVKYGFTKYTKEEVVKLLADNGFALLEVIEKKEPVQEIFGQQVDVELIVVVAECRK